MENRRFGRFGKATQGLSPEQVDARITEQTRRGSEGPGRHEGPIRAAAVFPERSQHPFRSLVSWKRRCRSHLAASPNEANDAGPGFPERSQRARGWCRTVRYHPRYKTNGHDLGGVTRPDENGLGRIRNNCSRVGPDFRGTHWQARENGSRKRATSPANRFPRNEPIGPL